MNGGALAVDGSIVSSPQTTVNSGAALFGAGTVGTTTIAAGGTLSPGGLFGQSSGNLTVQGDLSFTDASSHYVVGVTPTDAGSTNVSGLAKLENATVTANFAAGSYVSKQYTIVNAAGGLLGTFNSLVNTSLPSNVLAALSYDANNAFLNLTLQAPQAGSGLNVNQQNVANALVNSFNTAGGIPVEFTTLTPAGLTQVSGELAVATQQTTFNAMGLFMGVMTDPFIGGRDAVVAGRPVTAASFTEETGTSRAGQIRDAHAAIYNKAPLAAHRQQPWSVWAAGYGGSQTTDGNAVLGSNTTTSNIAGGVAGADYRFSPATIAGFALAGGGTNFAVANGLGSGRSDLFQAGAFVHHTAGAAYLTGALAYGWQDVTTDRVVFSERLRAQFNPNTWSGRIEGGYRFITPWMGLTPYAAGQFTTFDLPAYAEQGVSGASLFALSNSAKSVTASRTELGLRTDKSYAMTNAILTLRGRAAWAHDFNTDRNITATFLTLPGSAFVVNGATPATDAALVTASAETKWLNGFSLAATFEGEFSDVTRSYAGKGIVRYEW